MLVNFRKLSPILVGIMTDLGKVNADLGVRINGLIRCKILSLF